MKQIQAIYREENKLRNLSSEERLKQHQLVIKPLADALFVYLKTHRDQIGKSSKLKEAYDYFEYLLTEIPKHVDDTDRTFLEDLLPWSDQLPQHIRKP